MRRISISVQMVSLSALFGLPIALLAGFLALAQHKSIHFAERELEGLRAIEPLTRVLDALVLRQAGAGDAPLSRSLEALGTLGATHESKAWLPGSVRGPLRELELDGERVLRSPAQEKPQAALGRARELIGLVSDVTNLTLDPDLDTYYLMDVVVFGVPSAYLHASDVLTTLQAQPSEAVPLKVALAFVEEDRERITRSATKALQADAAFYGELPGLRRALVPLIADVDEQGRALAQGADSRGGSGPTIGLVKAYLDSLVALESQAVLLERSLLGRRIQNLEREVIVRIGVALLALVVASLLAHYAGSQLVRRVRRLHEAAQRFAQGDLDARVDLVAADEVGELGAAFDAMAEQVGTLTRDLKARSGELHEANVRLERTIQERTQLAYVDGLTGLANRTYLLEYLEHAVQTASAARSGLAVLALDLDMFKRVNDSFGHTVGDQLLVAVAGRIRGSVRTSEEAPGLGSMRNPMPRSLDAVAARLGGDEFVIVLPNIRSAEDAGMVAARLVSRLGEIYRVNGLELRVSVSVGIATLGAGTEGVEDLLKHADAALYQAKEHGRDAFRFFSLETQAKANRKMRIETALRGAVGMLETGAPSGLLVALQPKVNAVTHELTGAEALLRWTLDGEAVSPAEFIPVAEDTGLIVQLGDWVLKEACRMAVGLGGVPIAVNVSPRQFYGPHFVELVRGALVESGCPAELIELEITEGLVMQDSEQSSASLLLLKGLGLRLAVDDFGTGYSSLNYLARFPLDSLKVDRSFVQHIWNGKNGAIVSAIIGLARSLGLEVVVEGVETEAHAEYLEQFGSIELQGYHFGRAMPEAQFREWKSRRAHRTHRRASEVPARLGSLAPSAPRPPREAAT